MMGAPASSALGQEEAQMQVDDKFFAEFYRKHVAGSKQPGAAVAAIGYLEKHVADGAELVAVLRGMQADYRLFIVGRGRDRSSMLTEGLDEWAECLELGHVGDILASSDFSTTASVLIVQQYDAKKHYKVIDEEFRRAGARCSCAVGRERGRPASSLCSSCYSCLLDVVRGLAQQ